MRSSPTFVLTSALVVRLSDRASHDSSVAVLGQASGLVGFQPSVFVDRHSGQWTHKPNWKPPRCNSIAMVDALIRDQCECGEGAGCGIFTFILGSRENMNLEFSR